VETGTVFLNLFKKRARPSINCLLAAPGVFIGSTPATKLFIRIL